ncbi:hypothetical protein CPB83DRAFT_565978 [Crepidotus variabilis]|uniref:Uncharacterized protein n=1 Tax=Crepidotus variabilis TaxID=179855 RepID=A0A9P6JLV5_9AGAR|nr:hypothetical protein CPB83DRAFT_565978 [Crepidotus variabilis]
MIGLIEERQPLLTVAEAVVPLRSAYVWTCAKTWTSTHERDPQMRYLRDAHRPSPLACLSDTLTMTAILSLLTVKTVALAVHKGERFIIVDPPENGRIEHTPSIVDRVRNGLVFGLEMVLNRDLFFLIESRKRNEEAHKKVQSATKFVFGDRVKQMFYISIFAANMDTDIHNHAGALVDAVTGLADLVDQGIWVKSTSTAQTAFFRSHGFTTIAEVVLGDQNTKWHENPVIIDIMVREPRGGV